MQISSQSSPCELNNFFSKYKAEESGFMASLLLAFLASAGLFYINIFAAITDAFMEGAGLSTFDAGQITSANALGAAFGALAITLLIRLLPKWKIAAYALLAMLISLDIFTIALESTDTLIYLRFAHGFIGGALVGLGFSVIARTKKPAVAFGLLLVVQYGGGALGLWLLPPLVPEYGAYVPFYALIAFSVITLSMVPFIGTYPLPGKDAVDYKEFDKERNTEVNKSVKLMPLVLTLLTIFLFQAANMSLFAFIFGLGKSFGHQTDFLSSAIGLANIIAMLGAVLAIYTGTRLKILAPLTIALLAAAIGTWLLIFSDSAMMYFGANSLIGVAWAFCIPYLFTMTSKFDAAGQMAALGGFASKMGLATGPLLAGYLLRDSENYIFLINTAAIVLAACVLIVIYPIRVVDQEG
ncbi:MFS transporter [Dasania sp. GY-MA-18]|uniref:MFS transporter n=1 Tax=Dasania sp. GY-MA-18 TaxID=2966584 RepID=UPI0021ABAB38|nr:MFS transporter [Dasania sp. GY-MA-18]MCR8924354.1 MFS transporter [Dasania sp. GY-MA-18]